MEYIKNALKSDFKELYVKEFTTDWKEQRLVRELEIDVMSLRNLQKLFTQSNREVLKEYIEWCLGTPELEVFRNVMENRMDDYFSSLKKGESNE